MLPTRTSPIEPILPKEDAMEVGAVKDFSRHLKRVC
jgi:hypothetical protein